MYINVNASVELRTFVRSYNACHTCVRDTVYHDACYGILFYNLLLEINYNRFAFSCMSILFIDGLPKKTPSRNRPFVV